MKRRRQPPGECPKEECRGIAREASKRAQQAVYSGSADDRRDYEQPAVCEDPIVEQAQRYGHCESDYQSSNR
jgi:hypothetical protein